MSKRSKNAPRASRHLHSVPARDQDAADDQPLMQMLGRALRTGDPIDFLMTITTLIAATRPARFPWQAEPSTPTLSMLVESFVGVPMRETTAALRVLRELIDDDTTRDTIDAELATRRHPVPPWATGLPETTVTGVLNSVEELGDGENVTIGVRIPGAPPLSIVAFIDHNLGSAVKDAFPFPGDLAEFAATTRRYAGNDLTVGPLDPATARARLVDALERTDMVLGIPDSDTWPQTRPWLEWLIRLLPEGGHDTVPDDWDDAAIERLVQRFSQSPEAKKLRFRNTRTMAEALCWLHGDDPTRWSPVVVEILLSDTLPRKVLDNAATMKRYPALIRAFIRFCHREKGISEESTNATLGAVDHYEPEFLAAVNGETGDDDPLGAYLRAALADGRDPTEVMDSLIGRRIDDLDDETEHATGPVETRREAAMREATASIDVLMLEVLDRTVGGRAALLTLTDAPLPDHEIDWAGIPDEVRESVADVARRCDDVAVRLFDTEHRSAMRLFLERTARHDPDIFRRRSSPARAAAAIAWVITRANDSAGTSGAKYTMQELLAEFDVKGGISQRAVPFLRANGVDPLDGSNLGTSDLLTAQRRRRIIAERDMRTARLNG